MKSSLKKSLYLGLAAVSVLAASGFAATNASAKSYAYVTKADYFTTAPETRNVVPNGSHALYTKVGTSRGTRVVASKTTMGNLANSTNSGKFFRAYSIVTTNRGSVYYKVVSFDGAYRGWIYGGKDATQFGGGIAPAQTTKSADVPATTTGYTLTNPSKWTLWNNPKYTQYKAKKITGFKNTDTFTVTGATAKTREGWVYYQVKDDQNPSVTGWVYNLGVQAPQGNAVKVSYVDKDTGKEVGNVSVPFNQSDASTNLTSGTNYSAVLKGIPSGYAAYDTTSNSSASFASLTSAASAKNNDTVVFYVKSGNAANTNLTQSITVNVHDANGNQIPLSNDQRNALAASGQKSQFQVTPGSTITSDNVANILKDAKLYTIVVGSKTYTFDSAASVKTDTGANVQTTVTAVFK